MENKETLNIEQVEERQEAALVEVTINVGDIDIC